MMMKIVIKDMFLRQLLIIPKIYMICIVIYHIYQKGCNNHLCNLYNKKNCVVNRKTLKQALNHGLFLKTVHRVIKFNHIAGLKSYINMNTKLRTEAKNGFEKDFFKLK